VGAPVITCGRGPTSGSATSGGTQFVRQRTQCGLAVLLHAREHMQLRLRRILLRRLAGVSEKADWRLGAHQNNVLKTAQRLHRHVGVVRHTR